MDTRGQAGCRGTTYTYVYPLHGRWAHNLTLTIQRQCPVFLSSNHTWTQQADINLASPWHVLHHHSAYLRLLPCNAKEHHQIGHRRSGAVRLLQTGSTHPLLRMESINKMNQKPCLLFRAQPLIPGGIPHWILPSQIPVLFNRLRLHNASNAPHSLSVLQSYLLSHPFVFPNSSLDRLHLPPVPPYLLHCPLCHRLWVFGRTFKERFPIQDSLFLDQIPPSKARFRF